MKYLIIVHKIERGFSSWFDCYEAEDLSSEQMRDLENCFRPSQIADLLEPFKYLEQDAIKPKDYDKVLLYDVER